jgi:hypothetical protein
MCCSLLTSFPASEKKEREKRGKRRKKRKKGIHGIYRVLLLLPSLAMAKQDWPLPRSHRVTCKAL